MPNQRILSNNFSGGEISPELFGRMDVSKVASGLAKCQNFIVNPQGTASNRGGFAFVNTVKNSAFFTRLIQFSFSNSQTYAIEMGAYYFRFHSQGATLQAGALSAYSGATAYVQGNSVAYLGTNYYCTNATTGNLPTNTSFWYQMPANGIYEIPHPYAQADIENVHYVQLGDVITLVHPGYAPMELSRYGNAWWVLSILSFATKTVAPGAPTATITVVTVGVPQNQTYAITALNTFGYEQSLVSPQSNTVNIDLTLSGNFVTVTWSASAGAARYNVYKLTQGVWAYIGQTPGLSFKDVNVLSDVTRTPPLTDAVFNSTGNFPSTVAYYQQRRYFAGTINQPMTVWATQPSSMYNMNYSIPSQDSDALNFTIAAQRSNTIQHLIPTADLIMLTGSTEWRINNPSGGAVTAATLAITPQAQNGCTTVHPIQVNNFLVYAASQGGHLREMSYQWQSSGYLSNDLCLLAKHLFDNFKIYDLAFTRSPNPVMWAVSSTGKLLGLTYVPEQQVASWHQHVTTNGVFETCVSVTENNLDSLYVIVNRTINGAIQRTVEVLNNRYFTAQSDAFFVDSGITYNGAPATVFSGITWLEGQTVAILGDGAVMDQQIVTGGSITLPFPVSKAQIGLPIVAQLATPPVIAAQDPTMGQSRVKSINKAWIRVFNSGAFIAGPDATRLTPIKTRHFESPGSPPSLVTDELQMFIAPNYNQSGEVMIQQSQPLPLTVVDISLDVSFGG